MACSAAYLLIQDADGRTVCCDMFWCGMNGDDREWWECHFAPQHAGLCFYHFELRTSRGHSVLKKDIGGEARSGGSEDWQLTVYAADFKTPDWLAGGVLYQIFRDRFCSSGEKKQDVPYGRTMHGDWYIQATNRATPEAATRLLRLFQQRKLLKPQTHAFLWQAMKDSKVSPERLRSGLPPAMPLIHKTGTSTAFYRKPGHAGNLGLRANGCMCPSRRYGNRFCQCQERSCRVFASRSVLDARHQGDIARTRFAAACPGRGDGSVFGHFHDLRRPGIDAGAELDFRNVQKPVIVSPDFILLQAARLPAGIEAAPLVETADEFAAQIGQPERGHAVVAGTENRPDSGKQIRIRGNQEHRPVRDKPAVRRRFRTQVKHGTGRHAVFSSGRVQRFRPGKRNRVFVRLAFPGVFFRRGRKPGRRERFRSGRSLWLAVVSAVIHEVFQAIAQLAERFAHLSRRTGFTVRVYPVGFSFSGHDFSIKKALLWQIWQKEGKAVWTIVSGAKNHPENRIAAISSSVSSGRGLFLQREKRPFAGLSPVFPAP